VRLSKHVGRSILLSVGSFALFGFVDAQEAKPPAPTVKTEEAPPRPPDHPVTAEQVHAFPAVCHTATFNRQLLREKLEVQRKQLPEWYPPEVWNEIEQAIENIDLAEVALPTYQKYIEQSDMDWLIKYMATPAGQESIRATMEADIRAQHTGASPLEAARQARELTQHDAGELQSVERLMTPADHRGIAAHAAALNRLQPIMLQILAEVGQAVIEKQLELSKAIAHRHQADLTAAKRKYDETHKSKP
jgi:hypothetical protein